MDYANGAGKSSGTDKPKVKAGSLDARNPYKVDIFDKMTPMVTKEPTGGIQGNDTNANKMEKVTITKKDGSKDYGKGNPYKSIKDLREAAKGK